MATDYRGEPTSKRRMDRRYDGPNPKRRRNNLAQSDYQNQSPGFFNQESPALSEGSTSEVTAQLKTTSHSKKERKNNRSTRIHSLRKQLARGSLPRTVHQDKERELAALLLDQDKDKLKQQSKKNLKKYHYVRFLERQKAEKKLKQMIVLRKKGDADNDLDKRIHEMEVNLNYSIYAPLGQKYVSVFPKAIEQNDTRDIEQRSSDERSKDASNVSKHHHESPNSVVKERGSNEMEVPSGAKAKKPPLWYEVERAMTQGRAHLEALRDGRSFKTQNENLNPNEKGQSKRAQMRSQKILRSERRPQGDQGLSEEGRDGSVSIKDASSNSDEDMSDGGFFER